MFYNIPITQMLLIFIGAVCLYVVILVVVFGKKLVTIWGKPLRQSLFPMSAYASASSRASMQQEDFPPLIDKPADHPSERAGLYTEPEDPYYEIIEEESITLLKSAEMVVEQIQETINGIESHPANPEEVFTKVRDVVSQYSFFEETEYYEAINSFIAVTVKRDCDVSFTEEQLKSLWIAEAA